MIDVLDAILAVEEQHAEYAATKMGVTEDELRSVLISYRAEIMTLLAISGAQQQPPNVQIAEADVFSAIEEAGGIRISIPGAKP